MSHSIAQAQNLIPAYLEKLCEELKIWGQLVREQELLVDLVYFGGGTPTSLTAAQLEQVLTAVQENFDLSHLREYCVEAGRPDTITSEKLETLRRFGVDRISVNPQTMQDHVLETIGRKHTTAQTVEAFHMARAAGFENINMDLIAGLPDDTPEGFHDTLEQILALDPDSITVHALTLKRAANLFAEGEQQYIIRWNKWCRRVCGGCRSTAMPRIICTGRRIRSTIRRMWAMPVQGKSRCTIF